MGTPVPLVDRTGHIVAEKYQLVRLLGAGGMGAVYEARNTWTQRRVAIKLLRPELTVDAEAEARFIREARAATAIAHPHIVDVLDMGRDPTDGALYIVQELLPGANLREHLRDRGGKLSLEPALDIALPVMGALAAAHARGILHRDVKPENIFLVASTGGRTFPKLIDFGISKVMGTPSALETTTGMAVGTPRYMSPEQLRGDRNLDGRVDVWAMGILLYEMLAGRCPYDGATVYELGRQLLVSKPVPLEVAAPGVPAVLARVIERGFAVQLEQRPASMQAFLEALMARPGVAAPAESSLVSRESTSDRRGEHDAFLQALARAPERPPEEPPPERLGQFRVGERIGKGGMGLVYRAVDEKLGREVAIKVLPRAFEVDPERRRRFLREARAAATVTHPNLVTIYNVEELEGRVFIAMELVTGSTLRQRLAEGRLLPGQALAIGRQVVAALAAVHQRGIVHRDLKPDNVMLTADGAVKVLDFGLARRSRVADLAQADTQTGDGRISGTPGYMSPEQAAGGAVDACSDVFALGVLLHELCTGRPPPQTGSGSDLRIVLLTDAAEGAALSPELRAVMARCLAVDPAGRFADAGELAAALESMPARMGSRRGRRVALAAAGLAVVAACAAVAVLFWRGRGGPDFVPSPDPKAQAAFREGLELRRAGRVPGPSYERAANLDRGFGAPRVRLAVIEATRHVARGRQAFQEATALRDGLSAHDRALLDAMEPIYQRQPGDFAEALARLDRSVLDFPRSPEVRLLRAFTLQLVGRETESIATARQAVALDPDTAYARYVLSWLLAFGGHLDEAAREAARCIERQPSATVCLSASIHLDIEAGRCARVESTVRRLLTIAPDFEAQRLLANALAAQGKPLASVEEALRASEGSPFPGRGARFDRALVAVLRGDFPAAQQELAGEAASVEKSRDEASHAVLAALQVEVLAESGQLEEARRIAEDFLSRRDAWDPEQMATSWAIDRDPTGILVRVLRRAGAMSERQARATLDARRDYWKVQRRYRESPWPLYARSADDRPSAEWAVERMGKEIHSHFNPLVALSAQSGIALGLAGQAEQALPYLEKAVRSCDLLSHPFDHLRARLVLGQVREQKGDIPGACAAYQDVIARWGNARPRSVTADAARARTAALGCR
jgi:serine/threonine-protein kinase